MNAKFFGNSLFGGEFFVKDAPLSDEHPSENSLKLSFQAIGNNLVITGKKSNGDIVTVFGVADTSSVTFEVTNKDGQYSTITEHYNEEDESYTNKTKNLVWKWDENMLNVFVSTYGFIKAVIYDSQNKEVVFPVKVDDSIESEEKITIVFPQKLEKDEKYTIRLLYSYNTLDVTSTVGDASLRNVGTGVGKVPIVENNGKLNWQVIPFISDPFKIRNPKEQQSIEWKNGSFQMATINNNVNFNIGSDFKNGNKLILQIKNNGYDVSINGIRIDNFVGTYNLTIVKIDDVLQYWGKQEVKEIRI